MSHDDAQAAPPDPRVVLLAVRHRALVASDEAIGKRLSVLAGKAEQIAKRHAHRQSGRRAQRDSRAVRLAIAVLLRRQAELAERGTRLKRRAAHLAAGA